MEFIGSRDHNRVKIFALQHFVQAAVGVFDLEFCCDLVSTVRGGIRHRDQAGFGHEPANIFGMALAHLPDAENTYAQLAHLKILSERF
jgi:hypothetical protein